MSKPRKHCPIELRESRNLEATLGQVDFSDPRYNLADQIHGFLRGNNCLNREKKSLEVIALIIKKLPPPQVVETLAPEVIELRKAELEHRSRALELQKQNAEAKRLRVEQEEASSRVYERCFIRCAKQLLPSADYQALVSLTNSRMASPSDSGPT